jgi:hypothetical protein
MFLTLFMFLPFIATFTLASWNTSPDEARAKDHQHGRNSLCQG